MAHGTSMCLKYIPMCGVEFDHNWGKDFRWLFSKWEAPNEQSALIEYIDCHIDHALQGNLSSYWVQQN